MSEVSERYRKVADQFTERVRAVPAGGWDSATPCAGWVARDLVRHVAEASGMFLGFAGVTMPELPPVEKDPLETWEAARAAVQQALDDPAVATREFDSPMGRTTLEAAVGRFGIGDVLVHTWDLARATGLDERLDPDEVVRLQAAMEPNDERMRASGSFGPKVPVPDDADPQTRLIAFTGRQP